jgi:hypothetical protein
VSDCVPNSAYKPGVSSGQAGGAVSLSKDMDMFIYNMKLNYLGLCGIRAGESLYSPY